VAERTQALQQDRDDLTALVAASSTEAALDAQRGRIAARIAAQRDNSRVLEFPVRAGGPARRDRPAMRWLAAAAAAGLFVGMLTGPRVQPVLVGLLEPSAGQHRPLTQPRQERAAGEGVSWHDETFLSELETAVNNRGAAPLRALDDLTPEPMPASVRSSR
jgi:hypothetical protein